LIIITGGAGFIGSNLVRAFNNAGREDIVVVDDLSEGRKFANISDCHIADYLDKDEFRKIINTENNNFENPEIVFHLGACSDTTEWDGRFMLDNNFSYSQELLNFCTQLKIPFIYASSASVYGSNTQFSEDRSCEKPINVYAYSKLLFDNYVRALLSRTKSQVVGLRYFNVFGRGESHKGAMSSVIYQFNKQLNESDRVKLFEGHGEYSSGEQSRDFVHVEDIVKLNFWFMQKPKISGIYNAGTGEPRTFNDVAKTVIEWHGHGDIEYIPFPEKLKGSYQSYTKADLSQLNSIGCKNEFQTLEAGVKEYLTWLNRTAV
jgi:ADP-L-glycero-D-manno-heptose 6-epimerase